MDALVKAASPTEVRTVMRCARCGIESPEHTCFVFPQPADKSARDIRCITCEESRLATGAIDGALGLVRTIFVPLILLVAAQRALGELTIPVLLAACVMTPVSIVVHELGHAVAARLVGLQVGAVIFGVGRKIWHGEIFGTAVTLHVWPLSGLTFFGAQNLDLLRTRLWFVTLMGPAINAMLALTAAAQWSEWVPTVGVPVLSLWIITNALLALQSLIPRQFSHAGAMLSTDGLALIQIPLRSSEQLESYLFTAPLLRALQRFESHDYAGAEAICREGLDLVPDSVHLRALLTACRNYSHDYTGSLALLAPLLREQANAEPQVRAAIQNNMAFALLMSNARAGYDHEALARADRLSADVFECYPCILAYRSTRAMILTATGRPDQALELLDYAHYESADPVARGHREVARAFALRALGRTEAARRAAGEAARLNPDAPGFLAVLEL